MNKSNELIYLDNNGTTKICQEAKDEMVKWLNTYGNASTNNILGENAKKVIDNAKKYIYKHCNINESAYEIIFTSGGTESNNFIIHSATRAYTKLVKTKSHIIISEIEHHSILDCCTTLEGYGCIEVTKLKPNNYGLINTNDLKKAIKKNTCLISIMHANNEIGSINNIKELAKIAHENEIPFHTDAVQSFGKYKMDIHDLNVDAVSVSFHKFYGPTGIGLMIISKEFIKAYELKGLINGSQQGGLRGGTEAVHLIAGAHKALEINFKNRSKKNSHLLELRKLFIKKINDFMTVKYFDTFKKNFKNNLTEYELNGTNIYFILFGPHEMFSAQYVPNTILLSILCHTKKFCNSILKKDLENNGIIVSIGSACATNNEKASHVLYSLDAPEIVKRGTIRISFGDYNTPNDVVNFIKQLFKCIDKQIPLFKQIKNNIENQTKSED